MDYVIKFMFYVLIAMLIIAPIAMYISWVMDGKKVSFKDWVKNF